MMVAICEKAALFRETLATVVTSRGHHVVCCVSVFADAARAIERCNPDVMLLDTSLADGDSLAWLGARRERGLALRVFLLTASGEDSSAAAALRAGHADGVLDHAVALATLERAVNGQLTSTSRPTMRVAQAPRTDWLLTAREREVIGLLLAGRSTDAIASTLGVSRSTVHSHVQSILRKLGAQSRVEAVSIYLGHTTQPAGSVRWS
ncbi:MAG: two component transcriptional regulator, LuxR family [Nocardioides sp.]|nr:two component transcriptional regulator, LuxR family [Nocardioides sp.]